jgi:ech hydrogenase subunit A
LCNDLRLFYLFFETTTLCSFLLIAFDQTPTAVANALRALWINNLAGLAFVAALVLLYRSAGVIDLLGLPHGVTPFMVSAIALLCLAAFIKAAQFPFQGWLLGAMVAPTPVSALLHSSTMVKIGVYLVLRLSPTIAGSFFAQCVAVYGAFCFVAAAALAVGQSNGKKVLAYSTVSNLGLIMACAGIGTASALTAGLVLILFHALTKALLFLCIGAIEQRLESRDIEDMRGLYATMPVTALITVAGVIMMIMPPFGMLLGKWMALESAAAQLPVITMTAVGSALTVMYWARWAGALMNDPYGGQLTLEIQEKRTWFALGLLAGLAGLLSLSAPWICKWLILPIAGSHSPLGYMVHGGTVVNALGAFAVFPLGLAAMAGFLLSVLAVKRAAKARKVSPYLGGAQLAEAGWFRGPQNQPVQASAKNYYLSHVFGEKLLTPWLNLVALTLLALIMGGTL